MRKGMSSAAAGFVLLLSGAGVILGIPRGLAADSRVAIVDKDAAGDVYKWRFEPAELTVPAGTTVVWQNNGDQPHTVTADDNSFDSNSVNPGGSYQHAFAAAGDFAYHCQPHPWMKAKIHVTGGASTPTTAASTATTQAAASPTSPTTATTVAAATRAPAQVSSSSTTTTTRAGTGGAPIPTTTTAAATATTAPASSANPAAENSTTPTTAASGAQ